MAPLPGTELLFISATPTVLYSGMVPGLISGHYRPEEAEIDLVRLAGAAGATLILGKVDRIEPLAKRLHIAGRPPLSYDVASLNVGSRPAMPPSVAAFDRDFPVKPLETLVTRLESLKRELGRLKEATIAVVGSGAGGVELAFAIRRRFHDQPHVSVALVESADRVLPGYGSRARRLVERALENQGIAVYREAKAERREGDSLILSGGKELVCAASIWVTQATAPELFSRSDGLKLDAKGFLRVRPTLQSESDPSLFGAGDCVTLDSHPNLPKAGVYSVREGPVLWENLGQYLRGEPLRPYRPQRRYLTLLNLSDGTAVACRGSIAARGGWAWRWKQSIDAKWMEKFQDPPLAMPVASAEPQPMRCGGCGSKVGAETLSEAIASLDLEGQSRPEILVGLSEGEDAAVHRPPAGKLEVQSVDYFRAFLNDPLLLGRVAAMNALNDIYAMNAKPFSALAIVSLPYASSTIQGQWLRQLMEGSLDTLDREGAALTGGHTTEGPELALGFSVTGYADERALFRKGGLKIGDKLILTKPLGSGALLAALMRGKCRASWLKLLLASLLQSNREAAKIFSQHGTQGCTDITGFGLAGHALEMAHRSKCVLRLFPTRLPLHEGFESVTREGIVSTLHESNARVARRIAPGSSALVPALFDPQTSGGLLAGVPADRADAALTALRAAGYSGATIVGEVSEKKADPAVIALS